MMIINELFRCFGDETFGIYDGKIVLNRYRVEYETHKPIVTDEGALVREPVLNIMCFTSEERLNAFLNGKDSDKFTVTEIDQTGNEWFEGMTFDNYNEAVKAFQRGFVFPQISQEQLRADIDYIAIMTGVEL